MKGRKTGKVREIPETTGRLPGGNLEQSTYQLGEGVGGEKGDGSGEERL